jgi:hypothetical protein
MGHICRHYAKRNLPWLKKERWENLGHLLSACLIYMLTLYISYRLEPSISAAVDRWKKSKQDTMQRAKRRVMTRR